MRTATALTTLAVAIELPDTEPVRIVPGIPAAVTLDFDLDASNAVDLTTNPAKVTVQPFLSVIPQLEQDRDHRVRGVLAAVDSTASTVTLNVRPFHLRQGEFGDVTFATDDQTRFEVNGATLIGAEGLDRDGGARARHAGRCERHRFESDAHGIDGAGRQQRAVGERRRREWRGDGA